MTLPTSLHPLYATIGGREPLVAVVDDFYDRVLADPVLAPLFAGTDMRRQRAHQVEFLAAAFGGPEAYRGPSLRQAHRGRGITREHFARVAGHLEAALVGAKVEPRVVQAILATVAALQPEIVG